MSIDLPIVNTNRAVGTMLSHELMKAHGETGRKYQGRVLQVISGAQGLDDWEWGVDLFSSDPIQFKKIVYEMRFDEVSARFGEFGSFYVGKRLSQEALARFLEVG